MIEMDRVYRKISFKKRFDAKFRYRIDKTINHETTKKYFIFDNRNPAFAKYSL